MRQGAPPQQHERAARRASHTSDDPIAIFRLASGHATSQLRPEGKGEWKGRLRAGSECGGVQSKRLPIRKPGHGSVVGSFRTTYGRASLFRRRLIKRTSGTLPPGLPARAAWAPLLKLAAEKFTAQRHVVTHDGRAVYEWEQTLEEVNAYVPAPPGVRACHVECEFTSVSLRLGLAGNPPYMQVR